MQRGTVTPGQSQDQLTDASEEGDEYRQDRPHLNDDQIIVGDALDRNRTALTVDDARDDDVRIRGNAQESVADNHVSRRTHRQELRHSFDCPRD